MQKWQRNDAGIQKTALALHTGRKRKLNGFILNIREMKAPIAAGIEIVRQTYRSQEAKHISRHIWNADNAYIACCENTFLKKKINKMAGVEIYQGFVSSSCATVSGCHGQDRSKYLFQCYMVSQQ